VTDRETLLAAILEDPSDDTPRLVLADLLRESDDPDAQARGRYLWADVTASKYRDEEVIEDRLYYAAQDEIAAVASAGFPAKWLAELGPGSRPGTGAGWPWDGTLDRVSVRAGDALGVFTRGMLSEFAVELEEWFDLARPALASWPVERATITDVPGLVFAVGPPGAPGGSWLLEARLRLPRRNVPMTGPRIIPSAVSPLPVLVEDRAEWRAEELFPDRAALVAGAGSASQVLAADLKDAAGERWPSPPRKGR
jgi:uncharacterized protein (TIGR02996 family)